MTFLFSSSVYSGINTSFKAVQSYYFNRISTDNHDSVIK